MFLFSFIVLAAIRLAFRHTVWVGLVSLLLSLWACWQAHVFYHWIGAAPHPGPKEFSAWLACAAWTCTLIGASQEARPAVLGAMLCCNPAPTLASWLGFMTGLAICLPGPRLTCD
ncbi:MAG: hypothetical protein U0931_19890 [Vulcanimicrobiota bacterium]